MVDENLRKIQGFNEVVERFGEWPSFHDSVAEQLSLNLPGETVLVIRLWNRHRLRIILTDILAFELGGTDIEAGCILFDLSLSSNGDDYQLQLDPTLGLGGNVRCRGVKVELF